MFFFFFSTVFILCDYESKSPVFSNKMFKKKSHTQFLSRRIWIMITEFADSNWLIRDKFTEWGIGFSANTKNPINRKRRSNRRGVKNTPKRRKTSILLWLCMANMYVHSTIDNVLREKFHNTHRRILDWKRKSEFCFLFFFLVWFDGKKEKLCIIFAFALELLVWLLVWRKTVCTIEWVRKREKWLVLCIFCTEKFFVLQLLTRDKVIPNESSNTQCFGTSSSSSTHNNASHTRDIENFSFQKRKKTVMNIPPTMGNSEWIVGIWRT